MHRGDIVSASVVGWVRNRGTAASGGSWDGVALRPLTATSITASPWFRLVVTTAAGSKPRPCWIEMLWHLVAVQLDYACRGHGMGGHDSALVHGQDHHPADGLDFWTLCYYTVHAHRTCIACRTCETGWADRTTGWRLGFAHQPCSAGQIHAADPDRVPAIDSSWPTSDRPGRLGWTLGDAW